MKVKKIVIEAEDEVTKADEVEAEAEVKTEEVSQEAEVVVESPKEEAVAEVKEEEAKGEEKAEEATEEKSEEVEAKVEEAEDAEKPEETAKEVADKAEMTKGEETSKEDVIVKLDFSDFKEQFEKLVSPIIEKVNTLTDKVDGLAKAAPTEGAADAEETPVENAEKSEKTEDASKEEVKKSDTSSEGASETETKLLEMIKGLKESFEARLAKVESQPAPSKVVVVRGAADEGETELQKVDARLAEIAKVRDADNASYMRNTALVDEALTLVDAKRKLMGGK